MSLKPTGNALWVGDNHCGPVLHAGRVWLHVSLFVCVKACPCPSPMIIVKLLFKTNHLRENLWPTSDGGRVTRYILHYDIYIYIPIPTALGINRYIQTVNFG